MDIGDKESFLKIANGFREPIENLMKKIRKYDDPRDRAALLGVIINDICNMAEITPAELVGVLEGAKWNILSARTFGAAVMGVLNGEKEED